MPCVLRSALFAIAFLIVTEPVTVSLASEPTSPEATIRTLVRANAEKDMQTLARFIAHDADIVSYTIGGRKYVGWSELEREMREEFSSVAKLEIPIHELKVWTKGSLAWFTMELDYIRFVGEGPLQQKAVLPLRESGVLERREDQWVLLSWHESFRNLQFDTPLTQDPMTPSPQRLVSNIQESSTPDLSGEWEILEVEDNKRYKAMLDKSGNGPYTQHNGRFVTTKFADRLWQGTWQQPGNDREGGFELLLSEDGTQAKGIWWYSRFESHKNIPPRQHGGTYQWKRLTPVPPSP
ncbi:MAG TPA: nuclear transport factor 2 family protein [Nitrospiraceae bacterium]|nr:nuclear transport factor 2 family protein [Nitrospiraceae bacterium]